MERITREEMAKDWGQTGVENAKVVDLISVDPDSGKVVLLMIERRDWGADAAQFGQIEEKINRYLGYVLDGFFAEHYPQYVGKHVRLQLDCRQEPHGTAVRFVKAARQSIEAHGMEFLVNVTDQHAR